MRKRTTQIKYALGMLLILAMLARCKNSAATGVTSGDSSASVEADVNGADSSKAAGAESTVDSKSESKIDAQADS